VHDDAAHDRSVGGKAGKEQKAQRPPL